MNRTKFLYGVIAVLVVVNLFLFYFIFEMKEQRFHPDKPRNEIIKRLRFDEKQIADYELTITKHRENTHNLGGQIQDLKQELYSQLNKNQQDSSINNIILQISQKQSELEFVHYNHFLEIKSICRQDQIDEYEQLTKDLSDIFRFNKRPHPPRKHE